MSIISLFFNVALAMQAISQRPVRVKIKLLDDYSMQEISGVAMLKHQSIMQTLKSKHEVLLTLIGTKSAQYLDIPFYTNIGDQLIYLGTVRFLQEHQIKVVQSSAIFNYRQQSEGDVLLLQGGGNLGDIYGQHQSFRERVVADNHHRRIIILPQTIHFQTAAAFEQAQRVMRAHPDLYLCVRDEKSFELAQQLCHNPLLLPDMAHQLYPVQPHSGVLANGTLALRRTDVESAGRLSSESAVRTDIDWYELVGKAGVRRQRRVKRLVNLFARLQLHRLGNRVFAHCWQQVAEDWMSDAVALFSAHEQVVTDRLHAHILSCLMDKPHQVYDNSYGKNMSYITQWTQDSPLVTLAVPRSTH